MRHLALFLTAFLLAAMTAGQAYSQEADGGGQTLAIVNGLVVDGTGSPPVPGHVIVRGETIVSVVRGELPGDFQADETIDAEGRVISPGFIDTHAHGSPTSTPEFENFLAMGVTTIALGQDGGGPRPGTLAETMQEVDEAEPGPNVMYYIGHASVRRESGVGHSTDPSEEDIAEMVRLVEVGLDAGAWGLTTGLEYYPGYHAEMEELVAVARPVAARDGLVLSHMRTEDDDRLEGAIAELAEQGRRSGARVQVSHMKAVLGEGAERAEEILDYLNELRADGVEITADVYPYTASFTGIGILFPEWAMPPNDYAEVREERRDELAEYLRDIVTLRNGPEAVLFGRNAFVGMTLAEAAEQEEKPFEEILIELGPRGAGAAYFVMDEELMSRFLLDPHVMVCSDGSPTMRHPRGYGAFARIINRYVVDRQMMPLEEAVHKMTGLPAETTRLKDHKRGVLAPGFAADILVFDPVEVRDTATFEEPHQLAEGFDTVIVNGVIARRGGEFTGDRGGRVLRMTE